MVLNTSKFIWNDKRWWNKLILVVDENTTETQIFIKSWRSIGRRPRHKSNKHWQYIWLAANMSAPKWNQRKKNTYWTWNPRKKKMCCGVSVKAATWKHLLECNALTCDCQRWQQPFDSKILNLLFWRQSHWIRSNAN